MAVEGDEETSVIISTPFVGVDDTTVLIFAVLAHCYEESSFWGKNMNFPSPDNGVLKCGSLADLWHQYFWLCNYYGLNLVRLGASDQWGTRILHEAWRDRTSSFYEVLNEMLREANEHGVWVCLVLAGSQEYPTYNFGGEGSVFEVGSEAYVNYIEYCTAIMSVMDTSDYSRAIFSYDCWNEPDHLSVNKAHWKGDQMKFRHWAENISSALCPLTENMVEMGTAGYAGTGGLWSEWGLASFLNITGLTGFDTCHLHFYASIEKTYLITDPLNWSAYVGKPLHWGEMAKNDVYPLQRWAWFEERLLEQKAFAWCNMVLRGTPGYPFTGTIPPHDNSDVHNEAVSDIHDNVTQPTPSIGENATMGNCTSPQELGERTIGMNASGNQTIPTDQIGQNGQDENDTSADSDYLWERGTFPGETDQTSSEVHEASLRDTAIGNADGGLISHLLGLILALFMLVILLGYWRRLD